MKRAAALLVFFWVGNAFADSTRVALVRPASNDDMLAEATTRVRAELDAAGFDVTELEAAPGIDPREQVEAARLEPPPAATLALLQADGGATADIWVADRLTGKTLVRHVNVGDVARARAPSVLAVRAVELLRASLLEATMPDRPPTNRPALPKDVARWMAPAAPPKPPVLPPHAPARARTHFTGELGVGAVFGAHGVTPAFAPVGRIGYGGEGLFARMSIVAPALGGQVTAPDGSATIRQDTAMVDIGVAWPRRSPWAVVGSVGAGAYHWHVAGEAASPYLAHDADAWGALGDLGLGVLTRLGATESWGMLLDVHALVLAPNVSVHIADTDAGGSARPLFFASAGFWSEL